MTTTPVVTDLNLAFVAGLAEQFIDDPSAVPEQWRTYFGALDREGLADLVGWESVAAYEARQRVRGGGSVAAPNGEGGDGYALADQVRLDWSIRELVQTYRQRGHIHATINPLAKSNGAMPHIDYRKFGLNEADLERQVFTGDLPLSEYATVREVIQTLELTYCRSVGYEIMHVEDDVERQWLLQRVESTGGRAALDPRLRRWILHKLTEASMLESFLGRKFIGAKRFSVEGGESIIPMLHVMIESAGAEGVEEIVLGMAHRGRLSVMINIMGQKLQDLFVMFKDHDELTNIGGGDVKYHMGQSHDIITKTGQKVHLSLCFNPSHLEFVDPVVEGRVRAKQERIGDVERKRVVPLLIHGDAAVIGQGIVPETLNLSQLEGYTTGGTVHIVLNNQIGFTTDSIDSRSTLYCTDISKMLQIPVMHVNAEDLNAVVFAAQTAIAYRQRFGKDFFIDLVAYRRHGHNEGDEPRFTQPEMYHIIDNKRSIREVYRDELIARNDLTEVVDEEILSEVNDRMEEALEGVTDAIPNRKPNTGAGVWASYRGGRDEDCPIVPTCVDHDTLVAHLDKLGTPPADFTPHRKLSRLLDNRKAIGRGEQPVDWAAAEHLAFSTLLVEGARIRLSGQDCQRGTFAHRHAVLAEPTSGRQWVPLHGFTDDPTYFQVYNSPLSEAGVLGFDFGYSLDCPDGLVIWEAQFGDFANGAQVIIDQFISSTEDKWSRLSGLVLLLPHGFEGQGPEHSSARLERFLQMCSEDNLQVCNLTTPAQIFHALRRQVVRPYRKPMIIMSPKSILRHKHAKSTLQDLATGSFQRIIADDTVKDADAIKRVLLCSGRVYYDLLDERNRLDARDVAIVRFEQLYPLSRAEINAALDPFPNASFFWVQDEPWNMGAWLFIQAKIRDAQGRDFPVNCISRAGSASPATGSHASHKYEQRHLLDLAFGNLDTPVDRAVREQVV